MGNNSGFVPITLFALVTGAQQRKPLSLVNGSFLRAFLAKEGFSTIMMVATTYGGPTPCSVLCQGPCVYLLLTAKWPGWHYVRHLTPGETAARQGWPSCLVSHN